MSLDGATSGAPPCATKPYFLVRDENSASGKRQYAALLAAKLANAKVAITGSNACARWPDGEDIDVVNVIQ